MGTHYMYREYDSQFQGEIIVTATHSGCDIYDIASFKKSWQHLDAELAIKGKILNRNV